MYCITSKYHFLKIVNGTGLDSLLNLSNHFGGFFLVGKASGDTNNIIYIYKYHI